MNNTARPSQSSPDTSTGRVQPITLGDNAEITDAFVNFNIGFANPPELVVMTNRKVSRDIAFPVSEDEDSDVMIGETDEGLFFGWQDKPAHPPADTSPVTKTEPVTHEELGVVDRVPMFDHVVKRMQNEREEGSVLSVMYKHEYPNTIPTRVEFAEEIIDRYVNGPLGTSMVSYWAHKKSRHDRGDKYDDYLHCDVELVEESIYTWTPKATHDISE